VYQLFSAAKLKAAKEEQRWWSCP